jgi:hypothetical protein
LQLPLHDVIPSSGFPKFDPQYWKDYARDLTIAEHKQNQVRSISEYLERFELVFQRCSLSLDDNWYYYVRDFIKSDPYFIFFSTAYHHEKIIHENGKVPFSWASNNLIKKYDYSHFRDHLSMLRHIRLFTPRSNEFLFCSFTLL